MLAEGLSDIDEETNGMQMILYFLSLDHGLLVQFVSWIARLGIVG